ncbi:MAG: rod shape-determining protein MreC [Proteobacteria bacterium]|nr:rod shape-determining protein MreC [Pseudomonadota bacterium]
MKARSGSDLRLSGPLRVAVQRLSLAFLVALAFGLMLLGKAETVLVERLRAGVGDTVAPVLEALSRPAAAVGEAVERVNGWLALAAENDRLREENARLLNWQTVARRIEAENRVLREQLAIVPDPGPAFVTARVVADSGGAFARSLLVAAGSTDGAIKGNAALTRAGLVGRVVEVGARSARVLLLTDLNSRIPVVLERTRARAILAGDNSRRPRLEFLPEGVEVLVGERVVTSGHAGVFPPGLPVGRVASVTDGGIRVEPFVAIDKLEFVQLLDYGLGGILGAPGARGRAERAEEP